MEGSQIPICELAGVCPLLRGMRGKKEESAGKKETGRRETVQINAQRRK
jgi:hypothetical protein